MDRCSLNVFLAEVKSRNVSTNTETAQDVWDLAHSAIIATDRPVLGVSKGGHVIDRETWWWNDKMQKMINEKHYRNGNNSTLLKIDIVVKRASKRPITRARSESLSPEAHV